MPAEAKTEASASGAAPGPVDPERLRLDAMRDGAENWRAWGPYVSDRQWGTVREDYSEGGTAWDYFTHDHARGRAYRWGEDGIAGFCDDRQLLCLSLALWNGQDPILKERLFGLTNQQGNHGEDVKELYYYVDAVPSHAYQKMLYKYTQAAYPYQWLIDENARRHGTGAREFELIDTGLFNDGRYFDVEVEYAKATPDDILMRVTVHNRGPDTASICILPQAWFRNRWSWSDDHARPEMLEGTPGVVAGNHELLGRFTVSFEAQDRLAFCDNETNYPKVFGTTGPPGYYKDGIDEFIVHGDQDAINPAARGTKVAGVYHRHVQAGGTEVVRVRLHLGAGAAPGFAGFDAIVEQRRREADAFYGVLQAGIADADMRLVQRQALAGMLWSKQFYCYDVAEWLDGDPREPPPPEARKTGRNSEWRHLSTADIISMPDKWEYPWFASWDLAFHAVTFSLIDPGFAKQQLTELLRVWFLHPNGQLPAYEWNFSDANPPVHAWATWRVFEIDRKQRRLKNPHDPGDLLFLERVFHKLLLNFTWWVNQKDLHGRGLFQGGFLGLDNIGVFNRDQALPNGAYLSQSDGTSWMAMYTLSLMRIALELAQHSGAYDDMATKFFEHFLYIAAAMADMGGRGVGLWNEEENFYFDVLNLSTGQTVPLRVRSLVGLIPLFAVETLDPGLLKKVPGFNERLEWFLNNRPDLARLVSHWAVPGTGERRLLSLLRGHRMKALLTKMLDPKEFLSDYGVRSLSRYHLQNPYIFRAGGHQLSVDYEPSESRSRLFGGNSNWRGPIWFSTNFLIIESLQKFYHYYGDDFKIECPTGSGTFLTIDQVAAELTRRLTSIFLKNSAGERQVNALYPRFQKDENFRDYVPFYEFFDGDTARGAGASHQTGWTGIIAKLLEPRPGYE
jgi:hypothetical protein